MCEIVKILNCTVLWLFTQELSTLGFSPPSPFPEIQMGRELKNANHFLSLDWPCLSELGFLDSWTPFEIKTEADVHNKYLF